MNLTPDPVDVITHLKDQVASKAEEAATNWSGMQLLGKRVAELEQENADLKQRLLAYEGDKDSASQEARGQEGPSDDGGGATGEVTPIKKSVKRKK